MRNLSAKIACALLAVSLFTASMSGCGKETAFDGTEEAFVIDGESVNVGKANFLLRFQQATMMNYYAMFGQNTSALWSTATEDGTYGDQFKADMLESIEKMYLLKSHADEYNVSLSEDEIAKADAAADAFLSANDKEVLKKLGVTKEDVSEILQLYVYQNKMADLMTADTNTEVSDDEAAQTSITYVKVSTAGTETDKDGKTIELTDKEKAEKEELAKKVLEKVQASEDVANADMSALAKEVDESLTATTSNYGSDDTTTDEVLKTAAGELKDGEVNSKVLEGTNGGGYYVLRLDKAFDQEKTEQKKTEIVNTRKQEKYNEILDGWLKDAEKKTTEAWDQIKVTDKDVYTFKQAESTGTTGTDSNTGSTSSSSTDSSSSVSSSSDSGSTSSSSQEGTDE